MKKNIIRKISGLLLAFILVVTAMPATLAMAQDRWPTQRDNSQFIGISLRKGIPIEWTGMDAWWPEPNGYIIRDKEWSYRIVSSIADLRAGDVILWHDDIGEQWTNHIGIVVDVAKDHASFTTAEGNITNPDAPGIGVGFKTYSGLTRRGSSYGKVVIWRHATKGSTIATHAKRFTQNIIDTRDTSIIDQYDYIDWCFCYVTTVLLEPPSYGWITLDVESGTAGSSLDDLLGNVYCVYSDEQCTESSYMAAFVTDETGTAYKAEAVYHGDTRPAQLEGKNGYYTGADGKQRLYVYGESNSIGYTFVSDCQIREMKFYCGTYYLRGFITGQPLSDYYLTDNSIREIEVPYDEVGALTVYVESDIDSYKVEYIADDDLEKYQEDYVPEELSEEEPSESLEKDAGLIIDEPEYTGNGESDEPASEQSDVNDNETTEILSLTGEDEEQEEAVQVIEDEQSEEEIAGEPSNESAEPSEQTGAYYVTRGGKLTHYSGFAYSDESDYEDSEKALSGWYYAVDGKLDLEYEGPAYKYGSLYYCVDGQVDESANGWIYTGCGGNNGWNLFENGKENLSFVGFDCIENSWVYLENSRISYDTTDIIFGNAHGENAWWCVKDGYIFYEESVESNSNGWWYVNNGKVDFDYKGFAENANGWWYLENGKVSFSKNDIAPGTVAGEYGWWFIKNSKVTFIESVEKNGLGWWYIKDGKVDFDYNGYASNSNGWWYLENGKVSFEKNDIIEGTVNGKKGWWLIKDSKVSYETSVEHNSFGWWYVKNGMVDFGADTVAHNALGWWKITEGKVDFNFTGLASNELGTWYLSGGKVDFTFNGEYAGRKIVNGKVS